VKEIQDIRRFTVLTHHARLSNIGIEIRNDISWLKSNAHVSRFSHVQSYIEIGTEGLSEHLLTVVIAHEIGHIENERNVNLELGRYSYDIVRHETYAWKKALENENIEENPEFFELAQWQINRSVFAKNEALNSTTDTDAQAEEIKRLNFAKFTKKEKRL